MMTWGRRYVLKSYVRASLWIVPFAASLAETLTIRVMRFLDDWINWTPASPFSLSAANTVLAAITTVTLSFLVFTFGSLLVAIQVSSAQLTPRIIATTLLRDRVIRTSAGLFIYTLLFALGAQARMETEVDHLVLLVAVVFGWLCILSFLFLVDYASRLMRPVSIVWRLGEAGLSVIELVYPMLFREQSIAPSAPPLGEPDRIVPHRGTSGIILAVNVEAIVAIAKRSQCLVEVVPQVGDFIAVGEPLFFIHGGDEEIDERRLAANIAFGPERTIEQDPTFAFRVIVDIGNKALSKAINDPTTAVLALDQLHRLLRMVGKRSLRSERLLDDTGQPRLILRTPNWEDFVDLACTEIRIYGVENPQIARRMRAMLDNLIQTLPANRHAALRGQLKLLDEAIDKCYLEGDAALARVADSQGLGGASAHVSPVALPAGIRRGGRDVA
jgi:uncharacterized membrane protein